MSVQYWTFFFYNILIFWFAEWWVFMSRKRSSSSFKEINTKAVHHESLKDDFFYFFWIESRQEISIMRTFQFIERVFVFCIFLLPFFIDGTQKDRPRTEVGGSDTASRWKGTGESREGVLCAILTRGTNCMDKESSALFTPSPHGLKWSQ